MWDVQSVLQWNLLITEYEVFPLQAGSFSYKFLKSESSELEILGTVNISAL